MINDQEVFQQLNESWNGADALRKKIQSSVMFSFAAPGFVSPLLLDAAYNLPFMHAYGVLADALQAIAKQHDYSYKGRELGRLLAESRQWLVWLDFELIMEGKVLRDGVAHRGELVPARDCFSYIDAIQSELTNWGLLATDESV